VEPLIHLCKGVESHLPTHCGGGDLGGRWHVIAWLVSPSPPPPPPPTHIHCHALMCSTSILSHCAATCCILFAQHCHWVFMRTSAPGDTVTHGLTFAAVVSRGDYFILICKGIECRPVWGPTLCRCCEFACEWHVVPWLVCPHPPIPWM
jgi:hypothetical protein